MIVLYFQAIADRFGVDPTPDLISCAIRSGDERFAHHKSVHACGMNFMTWALSVLQCRSIG